MCTVDAACSSLSQCVTQIAGTVASGSAAAAAQCSVVLLSGTVQVVAVRDPENVTVALVVPDPVQLLCLWCAAAALQPSIDDVGGPT
jgi:hypothetical protein